MRSEVSIPMKERGETSLRALRESQKLTLIQVESRSRRIAELRGNPLFAFTAAWLSQVENRRLVPGIYKLTSLSEALMVPLPELLNCCGLLCKPKLVVEDMSES